MTKEHIKPSTGRSPVSVRLTQEERAQLEQAARGMPLSRYIRARLFDGDGEVSDHAEERRLSPADRQKLLAQILARIGQSGLPAALEELAELARLGLLSLDAESVSALSEARDELKALRLDLLRALGLRPKDGGAP